MKNNILIKSILITAITGLAVYYLAVIHNRPVQLTVSSDRRSIYVGDPVNLTVTVKVRDGVETDIPDIGGQMGGLEIRDRKILEEGFLNKHVIRKVYTLTGYQTGEYSVPPLTARYRPRGSEEWKEVRSREIKLDVKSVLPEGMDFSKPKVKIGEGAGQYEIDAPIRFRIKEVLRPRGVFFVDRSVLMAAAAGAVLLIFTFLVLLVKKIIRRKPRPLTPEETTLNDLALLKELDLWKRGEYKRLCLRLSSVMTRFIKYYFRIEQREMLPDELTDEISKIEGLSDEGKRYLTGLIKTCDIVKYTRDMPEGGKGTLDIDKAIEFVMSVVERE